VAIVVVVTGCLFVLLLVWRRMQKRVRAAEQKERAAVERRDRFLATAAAELEAPLSAGRIDEARQILSELARCGAEVVPETLEPVDVAELVREIVEAPPFSDEGPPVILRANSVEARADRGRLRNGLRVLLWSLRREADGQLVITVAAPENEHALIEIDARGTAAAVEALERSDGVMEGLTTPSVQPGLTLAMRVGAEVARANGGRLSARALAGRGERYVLELPL
jgi:hypothetical protein